MNIATVLFERKEIGDGLDILTYSEDGVLVAKSDAVKSNEVAVLCVNGFKVQAPPGAKNESDIVISIEDLKHFLIHE